MMDNEEKEQVAHLSNLLQGVAGTLDEAFHSLFARRCSFVLVVEMHGVAQYVSNVKRADGKQLLEELLERWQKNKADVPALYNPDLPT